MNNSNVISVGMATVIGAASSLSDIADYAFRGVLGLNGVSDTASCLAWFKEPDSPFYSSQSCYPVTDLNSLHLLGVVLTFLAVGLLVWKAVDFFMDKAG